MKHSKTSNHLLIKHQKTYPRICGPSVGMTHQRSPDARDQQRRSSGLRNRGSHGSSRVEGGELAAAAAVSSLCGSWRNGRRVVTLPCRGWAGNGVIGIMAAGIIDNTRAGYQECWLIVRHLVCTRERGWLPPLTMSYAPGPDPFVAHPQVPRCVYCTPALSTEPSPYLRHPPTARTALNHIILL